MLPHPPLFVNIFFQISLKFFVDQLLRFCVFLRASILCAGFPLGPVRSVFCLSLKRSVILPQLLPLVNTFFQISSKFFVDRFFVVRCAPFDFSLTATTAVPAWIRCLSHFLKALGYTTTSRTFCQHFSSFFAKNLLWTFFQFLSPLERHSSAEKSVAKCSNL